MGAASCICVDTAAIAQRQELALLAGFLVKRVTSKILRHDPGIFGSVIPVDIANRPCRMPDIIHTLVHISLAKIFLDPGGDVTLWYDFTTECADFGKAATEVFFGLSKDIRSVSLSIKEVLNPEDVEKERAKIAEELYTFLDQILGRGFLDAVPHEEQPE